MIPLDKKIILFDGICNLCHGAINFIIEHDKHDTFRYASLQSALGQKIMTDRSMDIKAIDSIVLIIPEGKSYIKSTAALQITRHLTGLYPIGYLFLIFPKFLRDWVYDIVAKNRYRWFGKKEQCMIPTPELKALFIDHDEAYQS